MFQQDYSTQYGSSSPVDSLLQFKTHRSNPTAASSDYSVSSLTSQLSQTNPKDKVINKLKGRIRELERELFDEQRQRKVQIECIKKHVEILQKEMHFVGEENSDLRKQVRELREGNGNLVKALGERGEMLRVITEYQPEIMFVRKERKRTSAKPNKISTTRKRGNSLEAVILKTQIQELDRKIKRSQSKLISVRKGMR